MKTYPIKFEPVYKHRIWGGQQLREVFGKNIPSNDTIGESWEVADLPEGKSKVANGPLAGQTLTEVLQSFAVEITGDANYHGPFPLLVKVLDAQDKLSVQVHPDADTCKRTGKGAMKTECWYIISADEGASIYKGLKHGVTREAFAEAIANGTVEEMLVRVPVQPGECHFLPAGTAHAIGAGLLIAEIQTPSDTTYRVFDWNRVDQDGNARQLHVADALESIHFGQDPDSLAVESIGRLVDCEFFKVDKGHQAKNCQLLLKSGKMSVVIFVSGHGDIVDEDGESYEFASGDTFLIPFEYQGVVRFAEETEYLHVSL